jgi:hypothetical protein
MFTSYAETLINGSLISKELFDNSRISRYGTSNREMRSFWLFLAERQGVLSFGPEARVKGWLGIWVYAA